MKTAHKFAIHFDAQQLTQELNAVSATWLAHFNTTDYQGTWSGITLRGPIHHHHPLSAGAGAEGPSSDATWLQALPYTQQVLSYLETEKPSVRYLKLAAGSTIKPHRDRDIVYWDGLVRLHIPIVTNPKVEFMVNNERLLMQPGELWFADFSQTHSIRNNGTTDRIHLVVDCVVNPWLTHWFIQEGIILPDEQAPDPIAAFSHAEREEMIAALRHLDTPTAHALADEYAMKYKRH